MRAERYLEFLSSDEIRIMGHRIGLEAILAYYRDGYTSQQIADEFPELSLEKIDAAIRYYEEHRSTVDAYLRRLEQLAAESQREEALAETPPVVDRLRALKAERLRAELR